MARRSGVLGRQIALRCTTLDSGSYVNLPVTLAVLRRWIRARERFERTVAPLASEQPEREDWHAFPGAVPREELLTESGLNTQQLHPPDGTPAAAADDTSREALIPSATCRV